jgi:hypothetical protein
MSYYSRGHLVVTGNNNDPCYADTGESAFGVDRPCPLCHKMPTPEGYDACLGYIPGARSACCGHGVEYGYIVMEGYRPDNPDTIKLSVEFERGDKTFWLELKASVLSIIGWLLGFKNDP